MGSSCGSLTAAPPCWSKRGWWLNAEEQWQLVSKTKKLSKRDVLVSMRRQPVVSGHHFSILLLSLMSHHLTNYLNYYLTCAPDLVPHDWGVCDCSYNPITDHQILTIDFSHDQACDLSCDTMWLIMHLTSWVPDPVTVLWHVTWLTIFSLTDHIRYWWLVQPCWLWLTPVCSLDNSFWLSTVQLLLTPLAAYCTNDWSLTVLWLGHTTC